MFHTVKLLALLLAVVSLLCFALTPLFAGAVGSDDVDLGSMFDSLGGDFDPDSIAGIFDSFGGSQEGTGNAGAASDGSSPLDKIKELFPDGAPSSSAGASSAWRPPMFTVDSAVSEDGKTLSVTVYAHDAVGLTNGTITAAYSGCSFDCASAGSEAQKVNDSLDNGFYADVNDTQPGQVLFGFYLKKELWDAEEFAQNVEPDADPLVIDIADFDVVTFRFRLSDADQCAVEITCSVKGVYPAASAYGDVDGSGAVEAEDARSILRASVGLDRFPGMTDKGRILYERTGPAQYADMDGDGFVTSADARLALRTSVKLEEEKAFILRAAYSPVEKVFSDSRR